MLIQVAKIELPSIKTPTLWTSLMVQWLRFHTRNAGDTGLIPDRGELRSCMLSGASLKQNKTPALTNSRKLQCPSLRSAMVTQSCLYEVDVPVDSILQMWRLRLRGLRYLNQRYRVRGIPEVHTEAV